MSPIVGLTDRGLSFPEVGQIRKGAKKTDPKKPGPDLQYFRVEFDEQEVKAAEIFRNVYGAQPAAIRIILPFNEIERMWDAYLEGYTAGRMVARADGEKFIYLIDAETGELLVKNGIDLKTGQPRPYVDGQPVGFYRTQSGKKEPIFCKPSGRLKVIIPELARAAYLTVLTTSKHDIINISDQLRAFWTINNGVIAGIPLVLRRRPKKISTPNADGSRARRVKWLLSIEADPEWVKRRLTETKRLALPGNGLALPAPSRHAPSEVEDYEPDAGDLADADYDEGEVEEGEYTQAAETVAQPPADAHQKAQEGSGAAQAANSTGNGSDRPYQPETLKIGLAKRAATYGDRNASEQQVKLVAMLLKEIFIGEGDDPDDGRKTVQRFLFGIESLNDASGAQVLALLDWLKPQQDNGGAYSIHPMAAREAQAVYRQSLKAEGQLEMF
jgi:hypothetical protein